MPYLLSFNIFLPVSNVQKLLLSVYIASTGLCYCTVLGKRLHPCEQYAPHETGTCSLAECWLCYPPVKHVQGRCSAVSSPLHQRPWGRWLCQKSPPSSLSLDSWCPVWKPTPSERASQVCSSEGSPHLVIPVVIHRKLASTLGCNLPFPSYIRAFLISLCVCGPEKNFHERNSRRGWLMGGWGWGK